jgi:hypothetical protein
MAKPMRAHKTSVMASQYRAVQYDPTMLQIVLLIKGSAMTPADVEKKCGVSAQCINNWLSQRTKRPQAITMRFVLRALGYDLRVVPSSGHNQSPED